MTSFYLVKIKKYLEIKREQEAQEAQEAREMFEEWRDARRERRSSGGGFFSNAFGTAAGVKMGMSGKKNNSGGIKTQDYSHTSKCQKRGLYPKQTCAGCTMLPYCTRNR